ncbi:YcaO-like family protein [Rhizobium helianthi]|uniref:YcaO-like family protein n=1 Tax=Rhizobium helianthi TaxID=1132695 RepID=A0ABW4M9K8_9HYPH
MTDLRACSPGETFSRVSPFVSQFGITRIARQTGLDKIGIPVWCAFNPNSRGIVIANGKGLSDDAARTSAVMEAMERSIASQPFNRVTFASCTELTADGTRHDWLPEFLALNSRIPKRDDLLPWVNGWHLLTGEPVALPVEAVTMDRSRKQGLYWQTSDGLASGNTLEEALLHALLERVERDAMTLWELMKPERRNATRINPEGFRDPTVHSLLAQIEAAELQIALFDISSDIRVPCILCLLAPRSLSGEIRYVELTVGAGAAITPRRAALRAITEAAQSRMTFIAGARDDISPDIYHQAANLIHLEALRLSPGREADQLPVIRASTASEALDQVLAALSTRGLQRLYAVDLSPSWLPVKVVKVVAPELENPEGRRRQRFGLRALMRTLL